MHRSTTMMNSFRGYVAGGARSNVDTIDDTKLMQEMAGTFMQGEARKAIEAPQNYGFTSVCMPAEKDALGKIISSAEVVMNFIGGNRSFPVAGAMDDRRHRLMGLDPGDAAMFRSKNDFLQFLMHKDGGFMSAAQNKTLRLALIDKDAQDQQQQQQGQQPPQQGQQGATPTALASGSGSSGQSGQSGQQQKQKPTGQKSVKDDNQKATRFFDMVSDKTRMAGQNVHMMLQDGNTYCHISDDQKMWCGGEKGKNPFAKVVTTSGPAKNVFGRIG
jgi:phage gp45-like